MSQFFHSIVLFSGDDGFPIEFNIQHAVEKIPLKAMIEHGGGSWTLSNDAIYLVSPGTKIINVGTEKTVISSRYIFDCVKENFLLDMNDYRVEINEIEASDFSDDNSAKFAENNLTEDRKLTNSSDSSADIIDPNKTMSPCLLQCPSSNHAFDFQDTECGKDINSHNELSLSLSPVTPVQITESPAFVNSPDGQLKTISKESIICKVPTNCFNALLNSMDLDTANAQKQNLDVEHVHIESNFDVLHDKHISDANKSQSNSPIHAVIVSSSQPNVDAIDVFDNMILNKLQDKPEEQDDDCLSQSYTVSSSADAQIPKPPQDISGDIFEGSSTTPDSGQIVERQMYIANIEKEVQQILLKPSPKTIKDKTILVKYICCVKKLPPATVLHTLQNV